MTGKYIIKQPDKGLEHTGVCPIRSVKIVRPSSRRRAPKCCIARPTCTDSDWICPLKVGSEDPSPCSKRPAICYKVAANFK